MRDTITFTVPFGAAPTPEEQRWIGPLGDLVEKEDEAISFTLHTLPSEGEKIAIAIRCHDMVGGLRGWVDLQQGTESGYAVLIARFESEIWPKGKPDPEDDAAETVQQKLVDARWNADQSADKAGYLEMHDIRQRVEFMAAWPTLFQSADAGGVPLDAEQDWSDLSERSLGTIILRLIMRAYNDGVSGTRLGKEQPSAN